MCNLRVIFAVTEGHFDDLDTVRTRCDDAYWLDAPYGEGGVEPEEALSFLGRYLNASRLEPDEIEKAWTRRHSDDWLPNACTPCAYVDECHEAFGRTSEGFGLYPLNAAAAGRFVEALSSERFDPRDVVREVINRFLLQGAADMRQRPLAFPSDAALATFDRNTNPLPPLVAAELRNVRPTDHERIMNILRYWSENDAYARVKEAILESFGVEPSELDLEALRSLGGGMNPGARSERKKDPSEPRSDLDSQLSGQWRGHFLELAKWMGSELSARATNDLRNLVFKTILANLQLDATPIHIGPDFGSRFRAEIHIGIEGTVTQQNLDTAIVIVKRNETNAAALQGLILAAELNTHQYSQASNFRRLVASKIECWTGQVAERLTSTPSPSVVASVEGLIVASTIAGLATETRAPTDFLDAIFQPLSEPVASQVPRSERWTNLTDLARTLIPKLRGLVEAEFGESRGVRGNVRAIQADRLLPIIASFSKAWRLESPDPAIAPLMRNVATAVDQEWAFLTANVSDVVPFIDRERTWQDQTAKVIGALRLAHNAGRLGDTTSLDELTSVAARASNGALQSLFVVADLVAKERSLPEKLVALASELPAHVSNVHAFTTMAGSAIDGVEADLLGRQTAGGPTDMESITTRVLDATTQFAVIAKELAE
jgi:hypothetical protein